MQSIKEAISDDDIKQKFTELYQLFGEKLKYKVDDLFEIYQELSKNGYTINGFIGGGTEGPVFAAINNGSQIAIKILSADDASKIDNQLKIMEKFRNQPYIHQFQNEFYSEDGKYFFYITEKLTCDLEHIMKVMKEKNETFSYNQIIAFAIQMATALTTLEKSNVIHSDLKPANILYDKQNKCFKISDYGFSKIIQQKSQQMRSATQSVKGFTPKYAAPEILQYSKEFTCKVDIYSLGLILLGLIYGSELNMYEIMQIIGGAANISKYLKEEKQYIQLNKIIQSMLVVDRSNRISASDLLEELKSLQNKEESTLNRYLQTRVDGLTLQNFKQIYSSTFSQINVYFIKDTMKKIEWDEAPSVTENNQQLKKVTFTRTRHLVGTQSQPSNQLSNNLTNTIKQQNNFMQGQQLQLYKSSPQQDNQLIQPFNKILPSNTKIVRSQLGVQNKNLQQHPQQQQLINQQQVQTIQKQHKKVIFKDCIQTLKQLTEVEEALFKYKNDVNITLEVRLSFNYSFENDTGQNELTINEVFASRLEDCSSSITVLSLVLPVLDPIHEQMGNISQSIEMMSQNLTTLELNIYDVLSSQGALNLAVALEKCSTNLQVVGLSFSIKNLSIDSVEIRSISQSLEKCENMRALGLRLFEKSKEEEQERIQENDENRDGDEGDCKVEKNKNVEDYQGLYSISYIASSLPECKNLIELTLTLYRYNIKNEGLQSLGLGLEKCEKLEKLNISIFGIGLDDHSTQEEFGSSLTKCPSLSSLSVKLFKKEQNFNPSFVLTILPKLPLFEKLSKLTLFLYEEDQKNIQTVQTNLKECQHLTLLCLMIYGWAFDNVILLTETLETSNITSLKLILINNEIQEDSQKQQANRLVESLSNFKKLTNLCIYFEIFDNLTQLIVTLLTCLPKNITTLNLGIENSDRITIDSKMIGECLEKCNHLKVLNLYLWGTKIKSQGALSISNRLQKCINLTALKLSIIEGCCDDYDHDHVYDIDSVAPIIKNNLKKCKNLSELDIKIRSKKDEEILYYKMFIKLGIFTKFEFKYWIT